MTIYTYMKLKISIRHFSLVVLTLKLSDHAYKNIKVKPYFIMNIKQR